MRLIPLTIVAAVLAACATSVGTNYQAADSKGYGYSDQRVEQDRYRVTFAGDGATPAEAVEDYALRRAAELARANGYDWFRVVGRSIDGEEKGGVGIGAGVGTGTYGRSSGVSVGVGGDLGRVGGKRFYTARMEVLMGKGSKPEGADYYDAASVISSLHE